MNKLKALGSIYEDEKIAPIYKSLGDYELVKEYVANGNEFYIELEYKGNIEDYLLIIEKPKRSPK